MRVSRVYQPQHLKNGTSLPLDRDTAHYLGRVLRLKTGDSVNLFNGEDGEFAATITTIERHGATVQIERPVTNHANPGVAVHLGLGLSRGERFDYAVQKSTELGVSTITPLVTDFCEVKIKPERKEQRLNHWRRVAISACEQCGRSTIPHIDPPQSFATWIQNHPDGLLLDGRATSDFETALPGEGPVTLAIGPEGGFSDVELAVAQEHGYRLVGLGPRILRTETAPVVALTLVNYLRGELENKG